MQESIENKTLNQLLDLKGEEDVYRHLGDKHVKIAREFFEIANKLRATREHDEKLTNHD